MEDLLIREQVTIIAMDLHRFLLSQVVVHNRATKKLRSLNSRWKPYSTTKSSRRLIATEIANKQILSTTTP